LHKEIKREVRRGKTVFQELIELQIMRGLALTLATWETATIPEKLDNL